jgi:hypothetical protein
MSDEKKKVYLRTEEERVEFLAEQRAKCRASESTVFETEVLFKYNARTYWWAYLEKAQKIAPNIMTFREFWGDESSYPRTIAKDDGPVSLARK